MLYLIESQNFYKIGYTDNIEQRLVSYNTTNPDWKLIHKREEILYVRSSYIRDFIDIIIEIENYQS